MNILSKYKFVDDCKDIFDKILEFVDLGNDIEDFKLKFFDKVGSNAIVDMFESLDLNLKEEAKVALSGSDFMEVNAKFLSKFNENQISDIYKRNFKVAVYQAFSSDEFIPFKAQIDSLLSNL